MKQLISNLDPLELGKAWSLSSKAVRSRLNGERDLTYRELVLLSESLGVRTSDLLQQRDPLQGA